MGVARKLRHCEQCGKPMAQAVEIVADIWGEPVDKYFPEYACMNEDCPMFEVDVVIESED